MPFVSIATNVVLQFYHYTYHFISLDLFYWMKYVMYHFTHHEQIFKFLESIDTTLSYHTQQTTHCIHNRDLILHTIIFGFGVLYHHCHALKYFLNGENQISLLSCLLAYASRPTCHFIAQCTPLLYCNQTAVVAHKKWMSCLMLGGCLEAAYVTWVLREIYLPPYRF